jgi:hypothetical protein
MRWRSMQHLYRRVSLANPDFARLKYRGVHIVIEVLNRSHHASVKV